MPESICSVSVEKSAVAKSNTNNSNSNSNNNNRNINVNWVEQFQQQNNIHTFFFVCYANFEPIVCCLLNIFLRITVSDFAYFLQSYWSVMNKFRHRMQCAPQFYLQQRVCVCVCSVVSEWKGNIYGFWVMDFFLQRKFTMHFIIWNMVQIIAIKSISHHLHRAAFDAVTAAIWVIHIFFGHRWVFPNRL